MGCRADRLSPGVRRPRYESVSDVGTASRAKRDRRERNELEEIRVNRETIIFTLSLFADGHSESLEAIIPS
jgi:hypothetical protein